MRKHSKYFMLAVIVAVMLMPNHASALLIDMGDITRDTESGLEWLDLTETLGLSYNYVSGQLGVGGLYEGWRYAISGEVYTLMDHAGIPDIGATTHANTIPAQYYADLIATSRAHTQNRPMGSIHRQEAMYRSAMFLRMHLTDGM